MMLCTAEIICFEIKYLRNFILLWGEIRIINKTQNNTYIILKSTYFCLCNIYDENDMLQYLSCILCCQILIQIYIYIFLIIGYQKDIAKGCYWYDSLNRFEIMWGTSIKSYNFKMYSRLICETQMRADTSFIVRNYAFSSLFLYL